MLKFFCLFFKLSKIYVNDVIHSECYFLSPLIFVTLLFLVSKDVLNLFTPLINRNVGPEIKICIQQKLGSTMGILSDRSIFTVC